MSMAPAGVKDFLLRLKKEDLTVEFIAQNFANTTKVERDASGKKTFVTQPPKYNILDKINLKAGEYINTEDIQTTVGRILFNKLVIEGFVDSVTPGGYINQPITKKFFEGFMSNVVAKAVMEDRLPVEPNVVKFIQYFEFYGLKLCPMFAPSFTPGFFDPDPEIQEKKNELLEKARGDDGKIALVDAVRIEDTLIDETKKKKKKDPAMILFDSGSRGSFADNYKNMSIMVGPIKNPATGKYDVVTGNFMDGVSKEDIPAMSNAIVNAAYSRAVGTQDSGYQTKQFYAAFQGIVLDPDPESDCGSKGYLTVHLTSRNIKSYLYQYIVEGAKLVLLDSSNMDRYIDKTVQMRSPIGCLHDKICAKCAGKRYYILGIENAGLTTGRVSNTLMNKSMKAFHITKPEFNEVDPDSLLL